MSREMLSEVVSSRARLKIADLLSSRPRSLRELADLSGISVQGVLKHIDKLQRLGIVGEKKFKGSDIGARKVYLIKGVRLGDFSEGDLTVVKLSRTETPPARSKDPVTELELLAEDNLVQRRRIREQVRKLGRMIDQMVEDQVRMTGLLDGLQLGDDERLVLQTVFTEETVEDASRALAAHHSMKDPRRAIEGAIAKARRVGKK